MIAARVVGDGAIAFTEVIHQLHVRIDLGQISGRNRRNVGRRTDNKVSTGAGREQRDDLQNLC